MRPSVPLVLTCLAMFGCRAEECPEDSATACAEDTAAPDTFTDDCPEEEQSTWYLDADGDGYGADASAYEGCQPGTSWVEQGGDCHDGDEAYNPGADEDDCADPADYNCDGSVQYADEDGDGWAACEECDDADPTNHPGAPEYCDGIDNDCDGELDEEPVDATTWFLDADADSYGDANAGLAACEQPDGWVEDDDDCDDDDPSVNPGADELCDDRDNDCDGDVDENAADASSWFADSDGDGYGDSTDTWLGCDAPTGYVADHNDCDDANSSIFPGATEVCDGYDNDCDENVDGADAADATISYADSDGDGYGDSATLTVSCSTPSGYVWDATDCDDFDSAVNPAASEICDGVDNDCDGVTDGAGANDAETWWVDGDGDGYGDADSYHLGCSQPSGYVSAASDCDDGDASINPGAAELCNGTDDDCDGGVDLNATDAGTWWLDSDGDGEGGSALSQDACDQPSGYVASSTDCDDLDATAHSAGSEVCDGVDNDCDGFVDLGASDTATYYQDSDGDGYGDAASSMAACEPSSGWVADDSDCDDSDDTAFPGGEERCDGVDNDCDGSTDESPTDGDSWYADADSDGYGDAGTATVSCSQPSGYVSDASDCDDTDASVNPAATEACDGTDWDCDGMTKDYEGTDSYEWYVDADGDGYGDEDGLVQACAQPSGYVVQAGDCDDADASVYPTAADSPGDGTDQNCDGIDACGDLDCDGWPDIVFPNMYDGSSYEIDSYIYYGSAAGYTAKDRLDLPTNGARSALVRDFDGDGYQDILFVGYRDDSSYVTDSTLYWGSATGHSTADATDLSSWGSLKACADDLDLDGYTDIVLPGFYDGDYYATTYVYYGSATGYSSANRDDFQFYGHRSCEIEDLNQDGWPDLVLPRYYDTNNSTSSLVLWGSATGLSVDDSADYDALAGYRSWKAVLEDVDQDGWTDILLPTYYDGNYGTNTYLYYGSSTGYSSSDRDSLSGYSPRDVDVADFDEDGHNDVLLTGFYTGSSYSVNAYLYLGTSVGFNTSTRTSLAGYGMGEAEVYDFDGDGWQDILLSSHRDGSSSYETSAMVYYNDDGGGFTSPDSTALTVYGGHQAEVADLNADGYLDIVFACYRDSSSYLQDSFVFWGSASGFSDSDRTDLSTQGAFELTIVGGYTP